MRQGGEAETRDGAGDPVGDPAETPATDWAWRAKIRANPRTRGIYRVVVGVFGTLVTVVGIVAIPAPGPGWLIVFAGLAILASEFAWAARLLNFASREVGRWTAWATRQSLFVRALLALGTFLIVVGVLWLLFRVTGVPGFFPSRWIPSWTGLHH